MRLKRHKAKWYDLLHPRYIMYITSAWICFFLRMLFGKKAEDKYLDILERIINKIDGVKPDNKTPS